jgi:hypothetical protein
VAAFRAPFYFINLWLISDRQRNCTYLYYSIPDLDGGREVGCWGGSDMTAPFGVAGLGERCHLASTSSRSPSTTYVPSQNIGRNPAPLDPRKHRKNAMRCVCVVEEGDGTLETGKYCNSSAPARPLAPRVLTLKGAREVHFRGRPWPWNEFHVIN